MCLKKNILATLAYFNLFSYPLKKREILLFLSSRTTLTELDNTLQEMLAERNIYRIGEFYCLSNNPLLAERRIKGNATANALMIQARKSAAIIAAFPFVKAVAVSGSLSKHYADSDADIDFFIITSPGKLWLARSFLHLFKKIAFLFNRQDQFCMNYFIDEDHPRILEENIYTATEVVTLIPIHGSTTFYRFIRANSWTREYFPNKQLYLSAEKETRKTGFVRLIEKMFNNAFGAWLDDRLMEMTTRSWASKKKKQKRNNHGELMGMHAGKHFSKPDPVNFQRKLLQRYQQSITELTIPRKDAKSF